MTNHVKDQELIYRPLPRVELEKGIRTRIVSDRVSPKGAFYPIGFSIDEDVAKNIVVHDIKVQGNSQLCSSGSIPGSLFSVARPLIKVNLARVVPGQSISLEVTNFGSSMEFEGNVVGSRIPTKNHPKMLGFGHTEVAGAIVISTQSQLPFEPSRLFVPPHVLDQFDIEFIRGERYLDLSEVPTIPPEMLTTDNLLKGGKIRFSHSSVLGDATYIAIGVRNKASSPAYFDAVLLGK